MGQVAVRRESNENQDVIPRSVRSCSVSSSTNPAPLPIAAANNAPRNSISSQMIDCGSFSTPQELHDLFSIDPSIITPPATFYSSSSYHEKTQNVSVGPQSTADSSLTSLQVTPQPWSDYTETIDAPLSPGASPLNTISSIASPSPPDRSRQFILSKARSFFISRLGPRKFRVKYLVRAVDGILKAPDMSPAAYQSIWSPRAEIFEGSEPGPIARFRRLYDGHLKIKQGQEENACADRLCYIFLEHDLEHLMQTETLEMSRGRGRKTAAFCKQAESISSTVEAIRADRKSGRAYLQLLYEGGPGLLLRIGSQVATM